MKPLSSCANGDGRPVQSPSKVLCKECLAALSRKFDELLGGKQVDDMERKP